MKTAVDCLKTLAQYNNNSSDHTADIAQASGAVVPKELLQGKGNTVRRMLRTSTQTLMSWSMVMTPITCGECTAFGIE